MPLHGNGERVVLNLHGLDHSVVGFGGYRKAWRHVFDCLMVINLNLGFGVPK
jgi:hypothetical protein